MRIAAGETIALLFELARDMDAVSETRLYSINKMLLSLWCSTAHYHNQREKIILNLTAVI